MKEGERKRGKERKVGEKRSGLKEKRRGRDKGVTGRECSIREGDCGY